MRRFVSAAARGSVWAARAPCAVQASPRPVACRVRALSAVASSRAAVAAPAGRLAAPQVGRLACVSSEDAQRGRGLLGAVEARRAYSSYPEHRPLGMPALSPTMEKGNLAEWRKKEGDYFESGDVLAVIETDKSTMEWESIEDGYIAKILVQSGAEGVPVGQALAIIVDEEGDVAAFKDYDVSSEAKKSDAPKEAPAKAEKKEEKPAAKAEPSATKASSASQQQQQQQQQGQSSGDRTIASPFARLVASQRNVDLSGVSGTGPNNRIIAHDVVSAPQRESAPAADKKEEAKLKTTAAPSVSGDRYTDIPNSNIRKVIASRLSQSKQTIPHYYLTMEIRMDELLRVRKELNDKADGAYKLSVNDFVVKAAALALRKVPECNSSWTDQSIRRFNVVDINVAVDTDKGLLTPLVSGADLRGLSDINNQVRALAQKGRDGKLAPEELAPGTFTISNLGMFGISQFCAVINPPQACILAVGATEQKVVPKGEAEYETANVMNVTLSCDHRVVDGAVGARWLNEFKKNIQDPLRMLL